MASSGTDSGARLNQDGGGESLLNRWRRLRDSVLKRPEFLRWASSFPLTRPIARSRARALFDLTVGFVYSQVLHACVRLRLFEHLAEGPKSLSQLAGDLDLSPEAAGRLLHAAHSLKLVEPRGGDRYGLGPLGVALLGDPGVAAMVEHHALLYEDLQDPVALLRDPDPDTKLRRFWAYARSSAPEAASEEQVVPYSALMSASQSLVAQGVLDAYPVKRHRCLMDVGGGDGTFLSAVAARAPRLDLMLFDLPAVGAQARARFARAGLEDRVTVHGGDFFSGSLPSGADVVSLIRVIHDHDDDAALALLKAVHKALPEGGRVLLGEPMAQTKGAEPIGGAFFEFYLLAMGSGRPRTPAELTALLGQAGFGRIRQIPTAMPLLARLIIADALPGCNN